jgi:hypothetical protein
MQYIQCDAEVQAVIRKHAPDIERLKQQLEQHVATLTALQRDMEAWLHTIATTRLEAFKTIDVMLALVHQPLRGLEAIRGRLKQGLHK